MDLLLRWKEIHDIFKNNEIFRNFPGGPPAALMGGHWLMPWFPEMWPQIKNFPIRSDDVCLFAFPKSGINWLNFICYLIMTGNFDKPDCPLRMLEMPRETSFERFAAKKTPRLITSHLPAKFLPDAVFKGHVIYLYRNPKDVAVSLFYHYEANSTTKEWLFNGPFEELARRFMEGRVAWGPYVDHLKGYYELFRNGKPMLFLSYEQLKKDTPGIVRQIAEFLGKRLDEATLNRICYETSFEQMRKNKAVNWDQMKRFGIWRKDRDFLRKGKIGDWRSHFTDETLLAEFDAFFEANLPPELLFHQFSDDVNDDDDETRPPDDDLVVANHHHQQQTQLRQKKKTILNFFKFK